jgi:carnitine O-acetyltransferase
VSPDAFVQLSMQLAFFKTHEKLGNAYESGSLRKFYLGRTDIIRTCSSDVAEFLNAMKTANSSTTSPNEKSRLLLKAIQSHRNFTLNVINCKSFDRHLLGLKLTALENNLELPDLYKDVAFQKTCHYFISSIQVSFKFRVI